MDPECEVAVKPDYPLGQQSMVSELLLELEPEPASQ
jgi:hypothetical protein